MSKGKIVLAYSGGLDTSYCIKYLSLEGWEVHALTVNTGGFSSKEISDMETRAYALGAVTFTSLDAVNDFYQSCIRYLVYGNILRYQTYPLSVSAERVFQAQSSVEFARKLGATAIAHGSTGAGNDQIRFDLAFHILGDDLKIITPIRDQKLSRKQEIEFLRKHGVELQWEKAKYSINAGLWGTTIGGAETLTSDRALPDEAYPGRITESGYSDIDLHFRRGELWDINDLGSSNPVECIQQLDRLARPFGIGRDVHVGDTVIGIKGRVGFEAPAPIIAIKAHHLLEKHVLSKWQLYWKDQLANWYGMLLHEGQFLEPVMRDIEAFMQHTQNRVSGTVHIRLRPRHFDLLGISSDNDLMKSEFGQYGEMNTGWTGQDARGFAKILANSGKIFHSVKSKTRSS